MVTTEIIHDGLGNTLYRVARLFPNLPSASHAATVLAAINPQAFQPVAQPETIVDESDLIRAEYDRLQRMDDIEREHIRRENEAADLIDALQLSDDDYKNPAEPPRCATGVCGLD